MREVRDLHTPQIRRGDLQVPKLLGPKNKILGGTSKRHQCDIRSLQTARSRNKRRKTRAHSDSEIHLSGRSVKLQFGRGLPTSNKRGLDYISKPSTTTVRNDEPSGTHGLNRESHPMGKTLHERNAGRTSWLMAPGRIPRKPDCPDTTIQRRLTMVEGRMKLGGRATTANPAPQILLFTDNSTELKGAHIESKTGSGKRSLAEKLLHINVLEMRAAHLAIRHFSQYLSNKVVLLASYNTCSVVPQKARGGQIEGPVHGGLAPIQHGHGTGDNSPGATCSRRAQCFRGQLSRRGRDKWSINPRYSSESAR